MRNELVVKLMLEMSGHIYNAVDAEGRNFSSGIPYATDFYYHDLRFLKQIENQPFLWTFGLGFRNGENMSGSYIARKSGLDGVPNLWSYGWQDLRRLWCWDGAELLDISDDAKNWRMYLGLPPYTHPEEWGSDYVDELVRQLPEFYRRVRNDL